MSARDLSAAPDGELLAAVGAMDAAVSPAPPIDTRALAAAAYDWRALTIRQPWANAIVGAPGGQGGPKNVENRTTNTHRRGLVLIHAGLRYDSDAHRRSAPLRRFLQRSADGKCPDRASPAGMVYGAIVGAAFIEDCHRCDGSCSSWAEPGTWHWVLGRRRALPMPVLCKGALGFWRPNAGVLAAVLPQIGVAR